MRQFNPLHISGRTNETSIWLYTIVKQSVQSRLKVKKCWHHLLYVTSLVSLQQENVKKSEKLKNQFILKNNIVISSYLLNEWRNFNQTFGKDVTYDYIKSRKNSRFQHFSEKHIFEKTTRGPNWAPNIFKVILLHASIWEFFKIYKQVVWQITPLTATFI